MIIIFGLIFALSSASAGLLREPFPAYGPPAKTETTITEIQPSTLVEHKLPVVHHETYVEGGHHPHTHKPHYYYYAKEAPAVSYVEYAHNRHYSPIVTYAKHEHHHPHHPHKKPHYDEYYYAKDSPVVTYAKHEHHHPHHPHNKPHYDEYYYAKDSPVVTYAKHEHHHPHHPHNKPHYDEYYYAKDSPVVTYAKHEHHHPHHPHNKPHYDEYYYAKDSPVVTYAKHEHHHPHHPHKKPHYDEYYYAKDSPIVTYAKHEHHHPHHPHNKPHYDEYYYAKDSPVVAYAKHEHHHPHHPHKPHHDEYYYAKDGLVDRGTTEIHEDHEKAHKAVIDAQKEVIDQQKEYLESLKRTEEHRVHETTIQGAVNKGEGFEYGVVSHVQAPIFAPTFDEHKIVSVDHELAKKAVFEAEKQVLGQQEQYLGFIKEAEMKLEREPIADVKYPGVMYLPPPTLPEATIRTPIQHETLIENTEDHELAQQIHFDAEKKIKDQQRDYLELIKLAEQEREREIMKEGYKEPTFEYLPPVKSYETTTYRPYPEHDYHTTETATTTTENYEHAHQALLDAQKEVLGTHEQYLEFHKDAEKQQLLADGVKEIEKGSLYLPPVKYDATTETIVKVEDHEHAHQSLLEAQKEVIGQQQSYLEFHKEAEKHNIHELTIESVKPTGGNLGFGGYTYQVPHVLYGPPKSF